MEKHIEVKQVIISRLKVRGTGTEDDPIRKVLQIYELDGTLICEKDEI